MTIWATWLHNILVHVPIVTCLLLGVLIVWTRQEESPALSSFVRWTGWACVALTTVVAVTGLIAAPDLGGPADSDLGHHRSLGLVVWALCAVAAYAYERGLRQGERDLRMLAAASWLIAALAVIGAGHWGGATHNPDTIPWYGSTPPR